MTDDIFSLENFEYLCYSRQQEPAARELVKLLLLIDRNYGNLDGNFALSLSSARPAIERALVKAWEMGANPSLASLCEVRAAA